MLAGGALSGLLNGKEREAARFDGDRGEFRQLVLTKRGKVVEDSVKKGRQGQMRCEHKKDEVVMRQHASAKWNAKWTGISARNWADFSWIACGVYAVLLVT